MKGNELFLENVHIAPYSHGGAFNHEPLRVRKVLMHKEEIQRLQGKVNEKGYTLVPLSLYLNERGKIKVELGLARGKAKGRPSPRYHGEGGATGYGAYDEIERQGSRRVIEYRCRIIYGP